MKKIGNLLIIIGVILITVSVLLVARSKYLDIVTKDKVSNIMNIMEDTIASVDISSEDKKNYLVINDSEYIGFIHLENSDIYLPINKEYTKDNLKYSPTVYYGSIEDNNLIICAHNRRYQFGFLLNIKVGNKFTITDVNNNIYEYEVCEIEELKADSVDEMINNNYDLTLFTCTLSGTTRYTIRLNRI